MITDGLILLCAGVFVVANVLSPFCFALAYVWQDTFYPQAVSYNIFSAAPVSMIYGVMMLALYVLADRKVMPKSTGLLALYGILAAWITFTTQIAVVPGAAEVKYSAAIVVLLVAAFLPFVINTRVRLEALIMVMLFAAAAHILPWGFKSMVGGGGYHKELGLVVSNGVPLSESSMMADFVFFSIPLFLHLAEHNAVLPLSLGRRRWLFWGLTVIFAIGAFGSYARTGLVCLACMLGGYFLRAKRKLRFLPLFAVLAFALVFASAGWKDRMETISNYQNDDSAETRVIVWQWAWDFAKTHPLGGGFEAYFVQDIDTGAVDAIGEEIHVKARAFHSIYFSMLAEQGYPGLLIFLAIVAGSFLSLHRTRKQTRERADLRWAHDMAGHMQIALFALLVGDAFIDPSFYPILWYPLSAVICLRTTALRALEEGAPVQDSEEFAGIMV
jgi:putative inorganic carbon (hco3(-)) transporter